ncbi:hypothetical protein, partial [Mesorhizobium sp. M7A.F.Ca.CA.002.04.1.1]|uniref:hypothetical protein n=2 Tax=unclassified Mesorhizobium TaxID=325217 RepID=UPI0019D4667A
LPCESMLATFRTVLAGAKSRPIGFDKFCGSAKLIMGTLTWRGSGNRRTSAQEWVITIDDERGARHSRCLFVLFFPDRQRFRRDRPGNGGEAGKKDN